jgi:hypothetical protein
MAETHAHDDDHKAPERTTVQGTQTLGLMHGHEETDIVLGPVFRWFGVLALVVAIVLVMLGAAFGIWTTNAEKRDRLPSTVFEGRQDPPAPRLWPNPTDNPGGHNIILPEPPEIGAAERNRESAELAKLGFYDAETRMPRLPDSVHEGGPASVTGTAGLQGGPPGARERGEGTGGAQGPGEVTDAPLREKSLAQTMPSDSSGGLSTENRMR